MLVQSASIRGTEIKWKLFITIKQENLSFIDMAKHHEAEVLLFDCNKQFPLNFCSPN